MLQGATGISGPLVVPYMHGYRLPREAFVFSFTLLYQVFAVIQVASLAVLGLYTPQRVLESLLTLIPAAVALPLGIRIDRRTFDLLVVATLALSAIKLVYDALA